MSETFANFSEEQKKAITHESGPAMVLAGPGSGKTLVIVNRIRYLIKEKQIPPHKIAVITFTKAAALEMQFRAKKLLLEASEVAFGTFHSIFYQILRNSMEYRNFSIIDGREKNQILKQVLYTKFHKAETVNQYIQILAEQISYYLNTGRFEGSEFIDETSFYEFFKQYRKECIRRKKLDFDLILSECLEYLKENVPALQKWQARFDYFLVDEFQDCNEIQYKIIRLLAGKRRNVFVVGDDDQSIYSFRGADPKMMFRFEEDYKEAVRITLSRNFRCCKEILQFADASIRHNELRFAKELSAARNESGELLLYMAKNQEEEVTWLLSQIQMALKKGCPPEQIAILMRTEAKFPYISARLKKEGFTASMTQKKERFYTEEVVKDLMAYLRFVFRGEKRKDLLQVLNKPERALSETFFDTENVDFDRVHRQYQKCWNYEKSKECANYSNHIKAINNVNIVNNVGEEYNEANEVMENLKRLQQDLAFMKELDAYGAICYILYGMKYEKFAYMHKAKEEREQTSELIEEMKMLAKVYGDVESLLKMTEEAENNVIRGRGENENYTNGQSSSMTLGSNVTERESGIRLLTYHGSKGLEFTNVFLPFVNEYTVPHKKAVTKEAIEEERRMFYVAMTRAKDVLFISCVQNGAMQPSRFLIENSKVDKSASTS